MDDSEVLEISIDRPLSLAQTVARAIEEAVARGVFAPGSAIVESRLREQFKVSRSTMREALRLLQDRGLVEVVPHKGAVVTNLTARGAREIYTLRMLLESYAVRVAMEQKCYDAEALAELENQYHYMQALADQGNPLLMVEADMNFHRILCSYCDHEMLLSTLRGLQLHMQRFMLFTKLYQSDLQSEAEMHWPIIEALRTGSPERAEAAIRDHIRVAGELLVEKMLAMEPPPGTGK